MRGEKEREEKRSGEEETRGEKRRGEEKRREEKRRGTLSFEELLPHILNRILRDAISDRPRDAIEFMFEYRKDPGDEIGSEKLSPVL